MARTSFRNTETLIVVSPSGYFDVYAPIERQPNDRPSYRGVIAELGPTVRIGDKLSVRPDSIALLEAVRAWSAKRGAAAVRGELGAGRDHEPKPGEVTVAAKG